MELQVNTSQKSLQILNCKQTCCSEKIPAELWESNKAYIDLKFYSFQEQISMVFTNGTTCSHFGGIYNSGLFNCVNYFMFVLDIYNHTMSKFSNIKAS